MPVMLQVAQHKLETKSLEWHDKACLAVVVASGGYPGHYHKNVQIHGLESAAAGQTVIFHAGTTKDSAGRWVTDGGRILAVSGWGDNLKAAYDAAYGTVDKIKIENAFFRRDIGKRALEVLK